MTVIPLAPMQWAKRNHVYGPNVLRAILRALRNEQNGFAPVREARKAATAPKDCA